MKQTRNIFIILIATLFLLLLGATQVSANESGISQTDMRSEITNKIKTTMNARDLGHNGMNGYEGTFYVYLPTGGSQGGITVGIQSPNQQAAVWFKVTDPNGRVVWDRSTFDTPGHTGVLPNNGEEILSPHFSNCVAGNYKVQYRTIEDIRFDCWIYSW